MAMLIVHSQGQVQKMPINGVVTLGRQSNNTVPLAETKSSRRHARIVGSAKGFMLEDLGSSNGTFVNGERITRRILRDGDEIQIGDARIRFSAKAQDELVGSTMGNYEILSKIGQGGMGTVYKARQVSMDRIVALKLLSSKLTRDRSFVRGFVNEARLAGSLNHPNIIHVHDFGEEDGAYFFSMEYVEGLNVQDILNRDGKIDARRATEIVIQVAEALEYAHAQSIIHQDIKPQNIMIDERGNVRVADLGLAKNIAIESGNARDGVIMGTPHYLAPEIARRETVGPQVDQYALGSTYYHMLTGRVPFDGPNSLAVITRHISEDAPNPQKYDITLPDSIARIVMKMMGKSPKDRYASDTLLLEKLKAVMVEFELEPSAPTPALVPKIIPKQSKRSKRTTLASRAAKKPNGGAVLFVLILIIFIVAVIAMAIYGLPK